MGEEDPASLELQRQRFVGERDVKLALQVVPDPEVVISADIRNRDRPAPQLPQRLEHPHEALRDGVAVLEPEVEQVAVHVEGRPLRRHPVEKCQQVALSRSVRVRGPLAEMSIGDEIGAPWLGHEASV